MIDRPTLTAAADLGPIGAAWASALREIHIAHPDPSSTVALTLDGDPARLQVTVLDARDTLDPDHVMPRFEISTVRLAWFPGPEVARAWIAVAWAGYMQHEALERVTAGGARPIDPHLPPHSYDRGLRHGFPPVLTPDSLRQTLRLAMDDAAVDALMR